LISLGKGHPYPEACVLTSDGNVAGEMMIGDGRKADAQPPWGASAL